MCLTVKGKSILLPLNRHSLKEKTAYYFLCMFWELSHNIISFHSHTPLSKQQP
jgi:hypothetical protein